MALNDNAFVGSVTVDLALVAFLFLQNNQLNGVIATSDLD